MDSEKVGAKAGKEAGREAGEAPQTGAGSDNRGIGGGKVGGLKNSGGPSSRVRGANVAIAALSRVLAVLLLSLGIAALGSLIDSWLGTKIWLTVGIVLAMLFGISSLILVSKLSELDAKRAREDAVGGNSRTASSSGSAGKGDE